MKPQGRQVVFESHVHLALAADTDADGLTDSQEAPFLGDFDASAWNETITGYVNYTDAHDGDRDSDAWADGDANESTVVFRTNA